MRRHRASRVVKGRESKAKVKQRKAIDSQITSTAWPQFCAHCRFPVQCSFRFDSLQPRLKAVESHEAESTLPLNLPPSPPPPPAISSSVTYRTYPWRMERKWSRLTDLVPQWTRVKAVIAWLFRRRKLCPLALHWHGCWPAQIRCLDLGPKSNQSASKRDGRWHLGFPGARSGWHGLGIIITGMFYLTCESYHVKSIPSTR